MDFGPQNDAILRERGGPALQWDALRERIALGARSELGRSWFLALEPSFDPQWIAEQQARNAGMRLLVSSGAAFDFRGVIDPEALLDEARIEGAALEPAQLLALLTHA